MTNEITTFMTFWGNDIGKLYIKLEKAKNLIKQRNDIKEPIKLLNDIKDTLRGGKRHVGKIKDRDKVLQEFTEIRDTIGRVKMNELIKKDLLKTISSVINLFQGGSHDRKNPTKDQAQNPVHSR